jgi:hypothetical protein
MIKWALQDSNLGPTDYEVVESPPHQGVPVFTNDVASSRYPAFKGPATL